MINGKYSLLLDYTLALPDVKVMPHIVWEKPGAEVSLECRVMGEPVRKSRIINLTIFLMLLIIAVPCGAMAQE
jgi:hypothetical protein